MGKCSECIRPARSSGLCSTHLRQKVEGRAFTPYRGRRGVRVMPIACIVCGEQTFASCSAPNKRYRSCANGHSIAMLPGDETWRRTIHNYECRDARPCDFPGCGRERKGRFCMGHEKQKQRHGETSLTPLLPYRMGQGSVLRAQRS